MRTKKVIVIGGQGNGELIAYGVERQPGLALAGFANDVLEIGSLVGDHPAFRVMARLDSLPQMLREDADLHVITAFGGLTKTRTTYERFHALGIPRERCVNVMDPTALLSEGHCSFGTGIYIGPHAQVCLGAGIDDHCSLFGGCFISHGAQVRESCRIAAHAVVGANVSIGKCTHIGLNATILGNLGIGEYAIVGAGAVVTKPVGDYEVVVGNPARVTRIREDMKPQ